MDEKRETNEINETNETNENTSNKNDDNNEYDLKLENESINEVADDNRNEIKKYFYYDRKEYNAYKNYVRIVSVSLIVISLLLAGMFYENAKSSEYKKLLNNSYNKSYTEITEALDNIGDSFEKLSLYTNANEMATTFGIIYKESGNIESSLEDLPYDQTITNNISKFLNQVEDFSKMMLEKGMRDEEASKEDYETIETFRNYSDIFKNEFSKISISLSDSDEIDWEEISNETNDKFLINNGIQKEYQNGSNIDMQAVNSTNVIANDYDNESENNNQNDNDEIDRNAIEESTENAHGSLLNLSNEFSDYPSLNYDGKLSDNYNEINSDFWSSKIEISKDEATEIAKEFIGIENMSNMKFNSLIEGEIPYYVFDITMKDSKIQDGANIAISKRGGIVLWFYDNSIDYNSKEYQITNNMRKETSYIEVRNVADEYLKKKGYNDLTLVSANENYDSITLIYARQKDGIVYYADVIILKISLASMKVTGFNSTFYLASNGKERNLEVKISESEARNTLKNGFVIKKSNKTMLVLDSNKEVLCYEFLGEYDGNEYLIYVNSENGRKEFINKVRRNDSGMIIGDTYY